ncbi:type II secretion system F family protein [Methylomonas sp. AM2-LC]|uniref:type II secretion system F family protein n=1 Tax=Methylomonas sp. AM2-LC TaxID=3153301 RepID=UPI003266ECE8
MSVKKPSVTQQRLNSQQLALLFTQLARLEAAGLPTQQGISLIFKADKALQGYYMQLQNSLQRGASFAASGYKIGLFTANHYAILNAAENSGQLARVYHYLAQYYTRKASQLKKLKSRLMLPLLVLIIGIFLAPITDLFKQSISLSDYLKQTLGALLLLYISIYTTLNFAKIIAKLKIEADWHRLQLRIPAIKKWISQRQSNDFLTYLGLMLAAGLPFAEALPLAVNTLSNSVLKSQFNRLVSPRYLQAGHSAYSVLTSVQLLDKLALQIINSSEQSGKLADGLLHYTQQTAETLARQDEELAIWIPRILYSLIAIGMIVSIFTAYTARLAMLPS